MSTIDVKGIWSITASPYKEFGPTGCEAAVRILRRDTEEMIKKLYCSGIDMGHTMSKGLEMAAEMVKNWPKPSDYGVRKRPLDGVYW